MSRHTNWYREASTAMLAWKRSSATLPESARTNGCCIIEERGQAKQLGPYPICLPLEHAQLNLLPAVRDDAIERFERHGIEWHMASPGPTGGAWPSTHLLDSQVQCVNTLLRLAGEPELLLQLLRAVEPEAVGLAEVEDGSVVAFEWIGQADYLGEGRGRPRQRGKFVTSADALVVVERADGGRTGLVVEWKFTEFYTRPVPAFGRGGTDRREVYRGLYEAKDSPFVEKPPIDGFLHEPHYQLMRQALLANAMVEAGEFGIERAVLVHAVPRGNQELLQLVPGDLQALGDTVAAVWERLLPGPVVRYARLETAALVTATADLEERYGRLSPAL